MQAAAADGDRATTGRLRDLIKMWGGKSAEKKTIINAVLILFEACLHGYQALANCSTKAGVT